MLVGFCGSVFDEPGWSLGLGGACEERGLDGCGGRALEVGEEDMEGEIGGAYRGARFTPIGTRSGKRNYGEVLKLIIVVKLVWK
jgi:hypothetical protein